MILAATIIGNVYNVRRSLARHHFDRQLSGGSSPCDHPDPWQHRANVRTSVAIGVNARARTGSPVPIGAEPFRQGREHGHGRFWPLLQDGV